MSNIICLVNIISVGTLRLFFLSSPQVERGSLPDTMVHACLFFIPPTGHGIKPLDLQFMKKIHDKVLILSNVTLLLYDHFSGELDTSDCKGGLFHHPRVKEVQIKGENVYFYKDAQFFFTAVQVFNRINVEKYVFF